MAQRVEELKPVEIFGVSDREDRIPGLAKDYFKKLVEDPQINVHDVKLSYNSYGEFLFVTLGDLVKAYIEPRFSMDWDLKETKAG